MTGDDLLRHTDAIRREVMALKTAIECNDWGAVWTIYSRAMAAIHELEARCDELERVAES